MKPIRRTETTRLVDNFQMSELDTQKSVLRFTVDEHTERAMSYVGIPGCFQHGTFHREPTLGRIFSRQTCSGWRALLTVGQPNTFAMPVQFTI